MPVNFDGATSGDKYDYKPDTTRPFDAAPPVDTADHTNPSPGVNWGKQPTGNRDSSMDPPVPTRGTNPVDAGTDAGAAVNIGIDSTPAWNRPQRSTNDNG